MSPNRRLRMKHWLNLMLNKGETPGIQWEDKSNAVFRINWKHGSRHGYSPEKDAFVFRKWAEYTGKLDVKASPDPKRWKANFRCALNSLKDVTQLSGKYNRGAHAYRLYQFTDDTPKRSSQPIKIEKLSDDSLFEQHNKMSAAKTMSIKAEPSEYESRYLYGDSCANYPSSVLTPPLTPGEDDNFPAGETQPNIACYLGITALPMNAFDQHDQLIARWTEMDTIDNAVIDSGIHCCNRAVAGKN